MTSWLRLVRDSRYDIANYSHLAADRGMLGSGVASTSAERKPQRHGAPTARRCSLKGALRGGLQHGAVTARGHQVQKEEERPSEGDPENSTSAAAWGSHGEAVQRQTERVVEIGSERMQQATEASAAAAKGRLTLGLGRCQ